jgi:lactate permease
VDLLRGISRSARQLFLGSNTISNLTFGGSQISIAEDIGVSPTTILSLPSGGGALGSMIAIHNIVAVCAVLGLKNQEGVILKKTIIPALAYGVILATVIGILLSVFSF